MEDDNGAQGTLGLASGEAVEQRQPRWRACLVGLWAQRTASAGVLRALAGFATAEVLATGTPMARALDGGLRRPQRAQLAELRGSVDVDALRGVGRRVEAELAETEVRLLVLGDRDYPARLACVGTAPAVLSVAGAVGALSRRTLAVVGTRRPTRGGLRACRALVEGVAAADAELVIVSGGALGIDGCAHQVALSSGLTTVIVSATGIDEAYPSSHRALFREVVERGGAVVSQFPPGTPPRASRFPRRNPTIAGLAEATVVVEAPVRSGALQTAVAARRAGRRVWVVPGEPFNPRTAGGHGLIKAGQAALLDSVAQLSQLERGSQRRTSAVGGLKRGLRSQSRAAGGGVTSVETPRRDEVARPDWQRGVLARLAHEEVLGRDVLLVMLGDAAHARLLELELAGLVRREAGDRYRLVDPVGRVEDRKKC